MAWGHGRFPLVLGSGSRSIRLLAGVVPLDGAGRVGGLDMDLIVVVLEFGVVVRLRCHWEGGVFGGFPQCMAPWPLLLLYVGAPDRWPVRGESRPFICSFFGWFVLFVVCFLFVGGFHFARPDGRCSCSSSCRAAGRRGRLSSDW